MGISLKKFFFMFKKYFKVRYIFFSSRSIFILIYNFFFFICLKIFENKCQVKTCTDINIFFINSNFFISTLMILCRFYTHNEKCILFQKLKKRDFLNENLIKI